MDLGIDDLRDESSSTIITVFDTHIVIQFYTTLAHYYSILSSSSTHCDVGVDWLHAN